MHIRGLDNLTTADVRAFASEHYAGADPSRIEWIDDTSANILYELPDHASQALANLTETPVSLYQSMRKAKTFSTHPASQLYVREAFLSDVKKPHARDASRFYLLNPDQDPRERKSQYDSRRGRRGNDDRRPRQKREAEEEATPFDVNMYDDDPSSLAARITTKKARRRSRSSHLSEEKDLSRTSRSTTGRKGDLFSDKFGVGDGRLRDRSASPSRLRDGDGRLGFEDGESRGRRMRQRSRSPPSRNSGGSSRTNAGKELLPLSGTSKSRDLFAHRLPSATDENNAKELFPRKASTGGHRRSAALDGGGDLFAHRLNASSSALKSRSLMDRVIGGPSAFKSQPEDNDTTVGFNIRGTSKEDGPGFSIRGTAPSSGNGSGAKELFSQKKDGNSGKELFGSKSSGRSSLRA